MTVMKLSPSVLCAALLAGCGPGQDLVGTPVSWWHNLQGGAIAEQRPPPPGVDAPYPLIGTTPPKPAVTSAAARDALTASLIDQQGASHQRDTHDPLLVAAPPAASKPAAAAAPPSSATLDAAGMPPATGATSVPPLPKPVPTPEQQEAGQPALPMPPPPPGTTVIASGPLPRMPVLPPPPPSFPGFDIPTTPTPPFHPDLSGRPTRLANIGFQPGSDVLLPDARATLHRIATSHGGAPVRVAGYGDAQSDTPESQAAALRLGLARAAAAAAALEQLGVPQSSIELAASAFGRGASVTVVH